MRFKTEIRTRKVKLTIDGREEEVDQKYEEHVPVLPRDWDDISTKVGFGLVGVLTLISVVWSTVSIGSLLGGGVGFLAALLFDVSWAVCLLLEWKSRYDSTKRAFPRTLGWLLLIVTMAFIGWHGLQQNNVALAVVGACVSLFAKVLWLGIMKHIDRNLSDEHRQWVTKTISEANARMAVAQVMRQVARMEDDAVAQRLAIEFSRTRYAHDVAVLPNMDEEVGQRPAAVRQPSGSLPDSAGQASDNDRQLPDNDRQPAVARILTGPAAVRHVPDNEVGQLRQCRTAAGLVRQLSKLGITSLPEIVDVAADIGLQVQPGTLERAIRRENGKP